MFGASCLPENCASGDFWATFPPKKAQWTPLDRKASEGWETPTPTILVDSFPLRLLCSNLRRRIGWGWRIFFPPDFSVEVKLACFKLGWFLWSIKTNSWTAVKISCSHYLDEMMIFHQPGFRNLTWRLYFEGEKNKHCPSLATWVPELQLQTFSKSIQLKLQLTKIF